jgi:hypothetical protein
MRILIPEALEDVRVASRDTRLCIGQLCDEQGMQITGSSRYAVLERLNGLGPVGLTILRIPAPCPLIGQSMLEMIGI